MVRSILRVLFVLLLVVQSVYGSERGVKVKVSKEGEKKVLLYIDGVKYGNECIKLLDLFDPKRIASIEMVKGEAAKKLYNSSKDVIKIITVKAAESSLNRDTLAISEKRHVFINMMEGPDKGKEIVLVGEPYLVDRRSKEEVLFYIDGVKSTREDFKVTETDKIESISVVDGSTARRLYNTEGKVVQVKLKK